MTSSQEIQSKIEKLTTESTAASVQLGELMPKIIDSVASLVEKWMRQEVLNRIQDQADSITEGGIDALRIIKADLNEFLKDTHKFCEQSFGGHDNWPHVKPECNQNLHECEKEYKFFQENFKRTINKLYPFLKKHDLLKTKAKELTTWKSVYGQYEYSFNPGFDEKIIPDLLKYKKIRQDHRRILQSINFEESSLKKAIAREMWDDA